MGVTLFLVVLESEIGCRSAQFVDGFDRLQGHQLVTENIANHLQHMRSSICGSECGQTVCMTILSTCVIVTT